jgi:hypothetical protein
MKTIDRPLQEYVDILSELSERFETSDNLGTYLSAEHTALFKQKIMEVLSLLDQLLGNENQYSNNIIHTANASSVGFVGGPSYAGVLEIRGILVAAQKEIERKHRSPGKPTPASGDPYVADERLSQLKQLSVPRFDVTRLIRSCEEINSAYISKSYMSVVMLARAIVDHVPPIFGMRSFAEVANNFGGPKSFQQSMQHLEGSLRRVADAHLHVQIRDKEVLPEFPQVDFRSAIDVLLAEIIRQLKK